LSIAIEMIMSIINSSKLILLRARSQKRTERCIASSTRHFEAILELSNVSEGKKESSSRLKENIAYTSHLTTICSFEKKNVRKKSKV
jgi:hypothetical protein